MAHLGMRALRFAGFCKPGTCFRRLGLPFEITGNLKEQITVEFGEGAGGNCPELLGPAAIRTRHQEFVSQLASHIGPLGEVSFCPVG